MFYDESGSLQASIEFLTKCVVVNPGELKWIEEWLFSAKFARKNIMNEDQEGTGLKLLIFLFDCFAAFKDVYACNNLRHIVDALTEVMLEQSHLKQMCVAASLYFYEYRRAGSLVFLFDKLQNPEDKDEEDLKNALYRHLKAFLLVPFGELYFPFLSGKESVVSKGYERAVCHVEIVDRYFKTSLTGPVC